MKGVLRRSLVSAIRLLLLLAIGLFLPAGIGWWQGWLFLAVFVLQAAVASRYLWHKNPEIFVARSRIHKGTKSWDRLLLLVLIPSFAAIFPVAALDNGCHWSSVPAWLVAVGYVLLTIGMIGSVWAEAVNKFAEPGVRIQTDRGHKVVDTGPYAIVRHPLYGAGFIMFCGVPLALGSFRALIPVGIASLCIVVRTVLEDRMLQNELEGYRDYARRVRYRLIPGVW
jgi:protein-S-isoprenylcysteine O-methyltransferase Ste14